MPSKHLPTDQNNQKHQEVNALAPHVERKKNTAFVLWANSSTSLITQMSRFLILGRPTCTWYRKFLGDFSPYHISHKSPK